METLPILLEFQNKGTKEVQVDKEIMVQYLREFIMGYVNKKGQYFRIGESSGNIIHQGRTYGEISRNAQNTPFAKELEESIISLNPELGIDGFSYGTWISVDAFVTEVYDNVIDDKIKEVHNVTVVKNPTLRTQTYSFNGAEVVFVMYDEAASGTELYAVPLEVAKKLNLEDYSRKEVSRFEEFFSEIEQYSVNYISFFNND